MLPSIRASDFAELAPAASLAPPVARQRSALRAVLSLTSGRIGATLTTVTLVTALLAPWLAPSDPFALAAVPLSPPTLAHLMGTDAIGRDVLSGVLYGARTSLFVAGSVTLVAFVCGALVGTIAGWRGGLLDDLLMRVTELFQVVPRFFLVVVAVAVLGPGIDRIVMTLGLTSWPVLARVVRGEVLGMREADFVVAARASGATATRILWRELLPNVLPSAAVLLGLLFGQVILVEASLGFLGLGDPNALSWGLLAGQAQGFVRVAWWLAVFPGVAIAVAVLGINLLTDAWAGVLGGAATAARTAARTSDRANA
jgi:peptide/nickel transport system permease protein